MADELTQKQEAFCLAFLETGNAAESYRRAYDVEEASKDSWIYVEACQLLDNPKVTQRVKDLRKQAADLAVYNITAASEEYEQARQLAIELKAPAAAVSAVTGKVKLFGLDAPVRKIHEHTGKGGGPIQTEEVSARDILTDRLARIADGRSAVASDEGPDGRTD